jgi:hypothetical protein
MNIRRIFLAFMMVGVLASLVTGARAQSGARPGLQANRLEGTWRVTLTFSDDFQVKALLTVMAGGRSENEGTLISSSDASFVPNPSCLPEQGEWQRTGARSFIATRHGFCFDSEKQFEPAGTVSFRDVLTLNENGEEFTGRALFEILDPAGTVVFSANFQTHGVRQHPQAPPAP